MTIAERGALGQGMIETRASWLAASTAIGIASVSVGSPYIAVVALKPIAADLGSARSVPALAFALAYLGSALGGVIIGCAAERVGIRPVVIGGALMIALGLALSSFGGKTTLSLAHGVCIGLFGNACINAPLYVYVSRWFDRRRGSAMALFFSEQYLAGAIWTPMFAPAIAVFGWRHTMLVYAAFEVAAIVPATLVAFEAAPEASASSSVAVPAPGTRVLGWPPRVVQGLLCLAGFLCCVPMAMPQAHLVAFCSDAGISRARRGDALGAARLRFSLPPVLGPGCRPRQRAAHRAGRIGVPDHRNDRLPPDPRRGGAVRGRRRVRARLRRDYAGLCRRDPRAVPGRRSDMAGADPAVVLGVRDGYRQLARRGHLRSFRVLRRRVRHRHRVQRRQPRRYRDASAALELWWKNPARSRLPSREAIPQ